MSNPRPAGRIWPSPKFCTAQFSFFRCSNNILHTDNLSFDNLAFDIFDAGATLSCLLPLQLRLEFYITLS